MMYPHCLVHSWCLKNTCWMNECLPNLSTEFQTCISNCLLLISTWILNRSYFKCPIQPYTHTKTCFPHFPISIHGIITFQVKPQTWRSHPHPSQLRSHPNQARSLLSTPQYISASFSWTLVTTQICPSFLTSSPASSLLANLLHSQIVNQTISLPASQKGKSFPMFLKNKSQTNSSG